MRSFHGRRVSSIRGTRTWGPFASKPHWSTGSRWKSNFLRPCSLRYLGAGKTIMGEHLVNSWIDHERMRIQPTKKCSWLLIENITDVQYLVLIQESVWRGSWYQDEGDQPLVASRRDADDQLAADLDVVSLKEVIFSQPNAYSELPLDAERCLLFTYGMAVRRKGQVVDIRSWKMISIGLGVEDSVRWRIMPRYVAIPILWGNGYRYWVGIDGTGGIGIDQYLINFYSYFQLYPVPHIVLIRYWVMICARLDINENSCRNWSGIDQYQSIPINTNTVNTFSTHPIPIPNSQEYWYCDMPTPVLCVCLSFSLSVSNISCLCLASCENSSFSFTCACNFLKMAA